MNEKIALLQKKQKNLKTLQTVYLIGLIPCAVLGFLSVAASAALAGALVLIYIFVMRPCMKRYQQDVKAATIEESFRPHLKQIEYQSKNGVSPDLITDSGFLPAAHPNTLVIRDTIQGMYQAVPALLTDYSGDYVSAATDKNGAPKDTYDFLTGCYFDLKLRKNPDFNCVIWPESEIPASILDKQYPEMTGSSIKLSGKSEHSFRLYLPKGQEAGSIPEDFLSAFIRLAEYTPGLPSVQVCGGHLRIFIRNRFIYPMKPKVQAAITPQLLTDLPFPEIHYILRVADTLMK